MLALNQDDIRARLNDFNERAIRELDSDLQRMGFQTFVRHHHPQVVGAAPSASAAAHAVNQFRAATRHSRGLPITFRSINTMLLVLGSVLAYRMDELTKSQNRTELVPSILTDVAAACLSLKVADCLIAKLTQAFAPMLLQISTHNATTLGATALRGMLGTLSSSGAAAVSLLAQLVEWLVSQGRAFFESDIAKKEAHKQHASDCFTLSNTIQTLAQAFGTHSISYLLAGSTLFAGFGSILTAFMVVAAVVTIQCLFERAMQEVDKAGGFIAWIKSFFSATNGFQSGRIAQYDGELLREHEVDITPRLLCPITKALVVNPVIGGNRILYERDALFAHLLVHFKDPITALPADPSCYVPSPTAARLAKEAAEMLCARLTVW